MFDFINYYLFSGKKKTLARNMQNIFIILLLVLSITLSFTSCKKAQSTINGGDELFSHISFTDDSSEATETVIASTESSSSDLSVKLPEIVSEASPNTLDVDKQSSNTLSDPDSEQPKVNSSNEIRAIWISYLEMQKILKNRSKSEYTKTIQAYFDNIVKSGLNTVIFHVRSNADAFYKSDIFPTSSYFTGQRLDMAPFDPLRIAVNEAHKRNLRIEAWINPYRGPKTSEPLSDNDLIKQWYIEGKVFKYNPAYGDEYYFFNPADEDVKELIISGVLELINNYSIDGIHFDDYFYAGSELWIDSEYYEKNALENETLSDFRRRMVSELVAGVYAVSNANGITFGISPSGNIDNCLNKNYADVKLWCSKSGYVDYIAPQIYWSYGQGSLPFEVALENWKQLVTSDNVKLIIGLAAYKVQNSEFWVDGNILSRQITDARTFEKYSGFIIFRYEYYFSDVCDTERANIEALLK